jgi:hypothetical protein
MFVGRDELTQTSTQVSKELRTDGSGSVQTPSGSTSNECRAASWNSFLLFYVVLNVPCIVCRLLSQAIIAID